YDDLGDMTRQPHLVMGEDFERDPDFLRSPMIGVGARTPQEGWRTSWWSDAESMFESPLRLRYTGLDPNAHYKVKVVYAGDNFRPKIRLMANGSTQIHDYIDKPNPIAPVSFDVPAEATKTGTLELAWNKTPGQGGAGRGCQVAEVWLMRVDQ